MALSDGTMYQTNEHTPKTPATSLLAPKKKILLAAVTILAGGMGVLPLPLLSMVLIAVGAATFALLWRDNANPLYLLLAPAAYGVGCAFVGFADFLVPVLSLSAFFGGLFLGVALCKRAGRTAQVLLVALGIALPFAVVYGVQFVMENGVPSVEMIRTMIDAARAENIAAVNTMLDEMLAGMAPEQAEAFSLMFSRDTVEAVVAVVLVCMPAVLVDMVLIVAYFATTLYVQTVRISRTERYLPDAPYALTMSLASAILYLVSFLLLMFFAISNIVAAVAINLLLILLPGFALLAGKRYFWRQRHGLLGRWGQLAFVLVIILLFTNPFAALLLMGLSGAYEVVDIAIRRVKK